MNLSPRVAGLLVVTNVVCLATLGFLAFPRIGSSGRPAREITAERINIVDPGGRTVMAISNKQRIAAPVVGGKAYPIAVSEGREHLAGMIFFNQDGDEVGGLVFNSFRQSNGRAAGIGHLSFDRYGDNQVVALQYNENASGVLAGLRIHDRPADGQFKASLDLIEEARTASPARLAEIKQTLNQLSASGALGVERVFVGTRNQAAELLLKDSKGRVRARLTVEADDQATLEFLDETGNVTTRFPG